MALNDLTTNETVDALIRLYGAAKAHALALAYQVASHQRGDTTGVDRWAAVATHIRAITPADRLAEKVS